MAFELIPFPLSVLFILVFEAAFIAVLWKLRNRGKIYFWLSNLSLVLGVFVLVLLVYSVVAGFYQVSPVPRRGATIFPQPVTPAQILFLIR